MKREALKKLILWKDDPLRMPLIVRGARQVGKSWLIEHFGESHFENVVVVNFEKNKELVDCFRSLEPVKIISLLEVAYNQTITPGKTLLFLDEIQACPNALMSLRYFKEELRELHVIAAGSLLEFITEEENFSFPVGRVQFFYLGPLSFMEFLYAIGETKLIEYLNNVTLKNTPEPLIHNKSLNLIKTFWLIGGMPEAVDAYIQSQSFLSANRIQDAILETYQNDFGKYATHTEYKYLQKFFRFAPTIVSQDFKFSKIDPETSNPSKVFGRALELLQKAGIIHRIHETSGNGLPFMAEMNERKFKILFLDIGLMQRALGINAQEIFSDQWIAVNNGKLAEQFVGQELLSYSSPYRIKELYYWERGKPGSDAEVDYLISINSQILPVEVKSGKVGRLKSLHLFLESKKRPLGIQISQGELKLEPKVLTVPFYLISQLPRLVKEILN